MDKRVQAAIENWAPRFVANGVDMNVFRAVTAGLETWEHWCAAWARAAAVHESLAEKALAAGDPTTAGAQFRQAAVTYHFAKFLFVNDREEMKDAHAQAVRCYGKALPLLHPPGERVEVPYHGMGMPAVLRRPPGGGKPPVVVLIPGLDSAKEEFHALESSFLARGLATLSVDGPGIGESEYESVIEPCWEKPLGAVLDWLEARPDVDAGRAGALGVSLGGYYAARAAAFEQRLCAAIDLAGPYSLGAAWEALPGLTKEAFRVRSGSRTTEEARDQARRLDLAGVAERIRCPLLIIHGSQDHLFPPDHPERLYREVKGPRSLWLLEGGNHVCNNVVYRWRWQMGHWMQQALTGR